MGNLGFELTYKTANSNVALYPRTVKSQVLGWNVGEVFGPYVLTLPQDQWAQKTLILPLEDLTENDRVKCVKILSGNQFQIQVQNSAFNLIDPLIGIESKNGQIKFTCTNATPTVDLQVQVSWTR